MPQVLAPLVTFAAYAIRARVSDSDLLSVATAFSSLAIVSLVTGPTVLLLASIPALRVAFDCIDRIEAFCKSVPSESFLHPGSPEYDSRSDDFVTSSEVELQPLQIGSSHQLRGNLVEMLSINLRPAPGADQLLMNTTITLPAVPLTVITGAVGCGKTTLLRTILREVHPDTGSIERSSNSIAYCSQTPWIPNQTIRDIICGTSTYHADWYDSVTYACDLQHDFSRFHKDDMTMAGSRGCVLSGGQRQRLVCILSSLLELG